MTFQDQRPVLHQRLERIEDESGTYQLTVIGDRATLLHVPTNTSVTWYPVDEAGVKDGATHAMKCLRAMATVPSSI